MSWDLLLRDALLLDPADGTRARRDIAVKDGRIAAIAPRLEPPELQAVPTVDLKGRLTAPGFVDVHAHLLAGVSHYGIEPDPCCLAGGVTTAVDAGSAGAQTLPAFREIVERSATRLRILLNVSTQGMLVDQAGELEDLRYVDLPRLVRLCREQPGFIVGVKVRITPSYAGRNAKAALAAAITGAEEAGLPVMVHPNDCELPLSEILAALRPGDVLTHCYHGRGAGILDDAGRLKPCVREARGRGVKFDLGHGMGSFSFAVARSALEQDFAPDTLSTDLHFYSQASPVVDLPTTMTKFLHLGMPLEDCIRRVTLAPAGLFELGEGVGSLAVGGPADITVIELEEAPIELRDCEGGRETAARRIKLALCLRAGKPAIPNTTSAKEAS